MTNKLIPFFVKNRMTLILIMLVVGLSISSISNYNAGSFIIKGIYFIMMLILLIPYRKEVLKYFSSNGFKGFIIIIVYLGFTIIYSANPQFGLLKLLNLIIGVAPILIILNIVFKHQDDINFSYIYLIIFFTGLFFLLIIPAVNPFEYNKSYVFGLTKWSHVILGRFGSIFFIGFYLLFLEKKEKKEKKYAAAALILFLLTFTTGLRAGILGIIIFGTLLTISYRYYYPLFYALPALILSLVVFGFANDFNYERFYSIYDIIFGGKYFDGAFGGRFEAVSAGLNLFSHNPLFGAGFGGFNNGGGIITLIKYPHNIIIEILSELGIIGLVLIAGVFYFIIRQIKGNGKKYLWIWLFGIWLALFSKDMATNALVYLPLALELRGKD